MAECKNCDNTINLCAEKFPNTCGVWQGPPIPCLDICTGDKLSDAEEAMAEAICDLLTATDVSEITTCEELADILSELEGGKTLANFIRALSTFACGIRAALSDLEAEFEALNTPGVTLPSCFQYLLTDPCNTDDGPTLLAILQALLNKVCDLLNRKAIPTFATIIYRGSLSNFDGTGKGLPNTDVADWYLCNGQNGTPLGNTLPQPVSGTVYYITKLS